MHRNTLARDFQLLAATSWSGGTAEGLSDWHGDGSGAGAEERCQRGGSGGCDGVGMVNLVDTRHLNTWVRSVCAWVTVCMTAVLAAGFVGAWEVGGFFF